jgi:hypothetical protein
MVVKLRFVNIKLRFLCGLPGVIQSGATILKTQVPLMLKQTFLIGPSAVCATSPTERPGMRAGGLAFTLPLVVEIKLRFMEMKRFPVRPEPQFSPGRRTGLFCNCLIRLFFVTGHPPTGAMPESGIWKPPL